MKIEELSEAVIGCAIEAHRNLGPGLLESTYEQCLASEFADAGLQFRLHADMPVHYKNKNINCGYRIDVLVDGRLILETKSVESLLPIHEAQLLTYMRLARVPKRLLLNFNVQKMKDGIKSMVL